MAINALRVVRTSDTTPRRVPRRRTGTAQLRRRRADPARRTLVEDTGEEQTPAALPAGTPRQTRGHRKVQTARVRPAKGRPHTDGRNRIRPSDPHYAVATPPAEPRGPGPPHQGVATASRTTAETDASEVVKLPPAPVSSSTRGCLLAPARGSGSVQLCPVRVCRHPSRNPTIRRLSSTTATARWPTKTGRDLGRAIANSASTPRPPCGWPRRSPNSPGQSDLGRAAVQRVHQSTTQRRPLKRLGGRNLAESVEA
jgi:hypothetical protein